MKRILSMGLISVALLVACDEESSKDTTTSSNQNTSAVKTEETTSNNDVDFKTIIEDNLREGDKITQFSNVGDEIKATIKLAENDLLDAQTLAETSYTSISESLLSVSDWETLTINFENIGEVSFNRSEATENEYGSYFESKEIINKLSQK